MRYTQKLEDALFEIDDTTDVAENVLLFLNDSESFRDFGEGLSTLIKKYIPKERDETPKEFLKQSAEKKNISFNRNTLNNWFSGKRPKKGEQSRFHMYMISFAVGMNVEDTCELFKKVYLDRPFNMRDVNEFVFYYCIFDDKFIVIFKAGNEIEVSR